MIEVNMYYIYHIKGIKIGCTKHLKRRIKQQGFTEFEILEIHDNKFEAGNREIQLQKQYGYKVDCIKYSYAKYSEAGKIGGLKNIKSGHLHKIRVLAANKDSREKAANSCKKKIIGVHKKDKSIVEFDSITDASNFLKCSISNITQCLRGKQKTSVGYQWDYQN